jgi:hypothetical protein
MHEELPAMTGAEMQTAREFLGLTRGWLGNDLQMGERRMMRMEAGQERIPEALVARLDDVGAHTSDVVRDMIATYRRAVKRSPGTDVFIQTYKTDEAFAVSPDWPGYPAKWHRMCCARVMDAVPGVVLTYSQVDDTESAFSDVAQAG